jgi:EVE domain-containing protein
MTNYWLISGMIERWWKHMGADNKWGVNDKTVETMKKGDKIIIYANGKGIIALAESTTDGYYEPDPACNPKRSYPHCFNFNIIHKPYHHITWKMMKEINPNLFFDQQQLRHTMKIDYDDYISLEKEILKG